MSGNIKITCRVAGKLYSQMAVAQRTIFIAAALDMLELSRSYIWPEQKPRAEAVIHYARLTDLEALRKRFDEYVATPEERQSHPAANSLFNALNEWCGYKPAAVTLKPNLLARIVYFVFVLGFGYASGVLIARAIIRSGGPRSLATFAFFGAMAGLSFVVLPWINKFIATKKLSAFWRDTFFEKVSQPRESPQYNVDPVMKPRATGEQYMKWPAPIRVSFVIGALDMLSFCILFIIPQHHTRIDAMIRATSAFKGNDIEAQFAEYLVANEKLLQQGAVSGYYTALDDWSRSGVELAIVLQSSEVGFSSTTT